MGFPGCITFTCHTWILSCNLRKQNNEDTTSDHKGRTQRKNERVVSINSFMI